MSGDGAPVGPGTSADVHSLKRQAGLRALELVRDGMVIGLGSGTTAEICVRELGRRVAEGLRVAGVPSSRKIERVAREVGVPLAELDDIERLDLTVDGADEVELRSLNLVKGRGGSLLREKLVAVASAQEIIIVDEGKLVGTLGERMPVPIEVVIFGWQRTAAAIERLGGRPSLRRADGAPFRTDEGHYILDTRFDPIRDPERLAAAIKATVGVVEHGLFIGLADRVIVAGHAGIVVHTREGA